MRSISRLPRLRILAGLLVFSCSAALDGTAATASRLSRPGSSGPDGLFSPGAERVQPEPAAGYGRSPLHFEPNVGQTDARVRFVARSAGMTAFFTDTETVMVLGRVRQTAVRMKLDRSRTPRVVVGAGRLPSTSNYFIGNDPAKWRSGVPHYERIQLQGVYPGIDIVWYGNERQLEYDFIVAPGADSTQIQVAYSGVESLDVQANGDLILRTAAGELRQPKPRVYQDIGGKQVEVMARYAVTARNRVAFDLAKYDRTRELRIDPVVLVYSTYLGGGGVDYGKGIAVDSAGSAYVTGLTPSLNFPTQSAYQSSFRGISDAFVAKFTPAGNALVYSTYVGGSGDDSGRGIAVDGAGSAYITGYTNSTNFPTQGPYQAALRGQWNGFVTKLTPSGNALAYSTYLGGNNTDTLFAIAVDALGSAYVTGSTTSTNFPTQLALQGSLTGPVSSFVSKLTPAGNALVYSTYLGGSGVDGGTGIAVDGAGAAYVTGYTRSSNFPTQAPYQGTLRGFQNAFVAKVAPTGTALNYSTYLGGSGYDGATGIAVDGNASAYVTGSTTSSNFPTQSPYQASYRGGVFSGDAFVTKLTPAGNALVYSTYLGGTDDDESHGIAVDAAGSAHIAGPTFSTNFPTYLPFQGTRSGPSDAFAAKLTPAGNGLLYSTYLGGSGDDFADAIAADGAGSSYILGNTYSTNFPTASPVQATLQGDVDLFVTKFGESTPVSGLRFVPLTPCRIADTRNATGPFGGPILAGGGTRQFDIPASSCGVPANAAAYSLNVTVVPSGPLGYLTVWPAGQPQPNSSTLNSLDGRVKANAAIVAAGTGNAISVFATQATHLVLDINGYFVPATDPAGLAFYPVAPCRVVDTRNPNGPFGGPSLAAIANRTFPVLSSTCNVPSSARAYSLNMTVVPKGPLSYLTTWPSGQSLPTVSTLNAPTGVVTANAAIVPVGNGGSIDVFVTQETDLVIDINGYFAPAQSGGLSLYATAPCRVLDTREPQGSPARVGRIDIPVSASSCAVPLAAQAYVFNATVVPPAPLGYLTLWPGGAAAMPVVSTLNASDAYVTSNMAIVPAGSGAISAFLSNSSHLVLDTFGYFAP